MTNGFEIFVPKTGGSLVLYIGICVLLGIGFLFALTRVPNRYRKPIVIGFTFAFGFVYLIEFMFPGRSPAPIRSELKAAQSSLNVAQQDLYTVVIGRGSKSKRIADAQHVLDSAIGHLSKADKLVKAALPPVEKEKEESWNTAEKWAKSHKLPDSYLKKDPDGKIEDVRTKRLKKQVTDLIDVRNMLTGDPEHPELACGVIAMLRDMKPQLSHASLDDLNGAKATIEGIHNVIGVKRSSLADNFLSPYLQPINDILIVVPSLAFALGLYSLGSVHGKALRRRQRGWSSSLAFFVAAITIMVSAFLQHYLAKGSNWQSINFSIFMALFDGALKNLGATMFSLVAFYIVSAAYRSFRIKSAEAALMMAAAFVIMLALVPFGAMITNWLPTHGWLQVLRLERIGSWILNFPNAAAQRGMLFGLGVGGLAMSIRLWLSLERGSYFDKEM